MDSKGLECGGHRWILLHSGPITQPNLPSPWTQSVSGQDTIIQGVTTVSPVGQLRAAFKQTAHVNYIYTLHANQVPNENIIFRAERIRSASGGVNVLGSNCKGYAKGQVGDWTKMYERSVYGQDSVGDWDSVHYIFKVTNTGFTLQSDYEKDILFTTYALTIDGVAKRPTAGGGTAVTATPNAYYKHVVLEYKGESEGKYLSGSTDSHLTDLSVEIETSGNVPEDFCVMDVSGGDFELRLHFLDTGLYNFYFRANGALRKKVIVDYDNTVDITSVNAELLWGDLNNDNYVSSTEVNLVYAYIGASESDGETWGFDEDGDGYAPFQADFNRDGEVDGTDYAMASGNVGEYGD